MARSAALRSSRDFCRASKPAPDAATASDAAADQQIAQGRYAQLPLVICSERSLREDVFRIFDQTFAVTRTLQAMALLVAALGVGLATSIREVCKLRGEVELVAAGDLPNDGTWEAAPGDADGAAALDLGDLSYD